jgi:site-specific recombinase XerD
MEGKGVEVFTPEVGHQYCFEAIGSDILPGVEKRDQLKLRSIRMLISYQRDGCFEFRTPSIAPRVFYGETGKLMESFLDNARHVQQLAADTIEQKRILLYEFNLHLKKLGMSLDEISTQTLIDFCVNQAYSLTKKRFFFTSIRQFLRYAYNIGVTAGDMSFIVIPVNKDRQKLATTYTEDEIRRMLSVVERGSAIGKRDYLVLLLASEYGWRASDIVGFQFDWIDWDRNTIAFSQYKTDAAVQYPLLSSVGNAIIDYLKNGRPDTEAHEIIVAHETVKRGKKLAEPTIHSIVTKYLRAANIENWQQKKHGPHALRFSLATNLLKKNISIPVIATVLGHQSTESTKIYISLDIDQLRKCALPIPALNTGVFEVAV